MNGSIPWRMVGAATERSLGAIEARSASAAVVRWRLPPTISRARLPTIGVILLAGVLALTGLPLASAPSHSQPSLSSKIADVVHQLERNFHPGAQGPKVANASGNGTFWSNYTVAGGNPTSNFSSMYCDQYYPGYYCFPQAAAPSVLPLPNGEVGYAYEAFTNATTSTCPLALNNSTEVRVQFELSKDGGRTFGAPLDLGNTTCPYYQALEPSFAVGGGGDIFGAFVEANATPNQLNCQPGCGPYWGQALYYADRVNDSLAFVRSTNQGASFDSVQTLSLAGVGNISMPSVAAYGKTVYVAYMNINNTTSAATLGGTTSPPIASLLVYSTDAGVTWHGPYNLPGFNSTEYYNAMNPQVTVGPSGEVYVAYTSDRHCIAYCTYTSQAYGDNVYLATSTSNGTSWGTHLVAKDEANAEQANENPFAVAWYASNINPPYVFEQGPAVTVAVAPTTGDVYVAWTGAMNVSDHYYCGPPSYTFNPYCIYDSFDWSSLHVANSSNGGTTWTNHSVGPANNYPIAGGPLGEFMPGLGVSPSGELYVTYANFNGSYTWNGCYQEGSYGSAGFQGQWVATSSDGVNWSSPTLLGWNQNGNGGWWTTGWTSSVEFNVTTGAPLIGFALSQPSTNLPIGPYQDYTWPGVVQLAMPYTGSTTTLTLQESGLPGGTMWRAWVMGNEYGTTAINFTIQNAPVGEKLWVKDGLPPIYVGYGAAYLPNVTSSYPKNYGNAWEGGQYFLNLSGPGYFYFNFSLFYLLNLSLQPTSLADSYVGFSIEDNPQNFQIWENEQNGAFAGGCQMPWLVPAGLTLDLTDFRQVVTPHELFYWANGPTAFGYFNGTGSGSFTGPGPNVTITMNGPVNETGWLGTYGTYNITIGAPGLAAGSTAHFSWDGTPYSFAAPGPSLVRNVTTGVYPVSNIWASSSAAGYEYFGRTVQSNPVAVPNEPVVNLSFSYVHIGAPIGTVSFLANGTTPGTPWQLMFNGSLYASSTPWINVTTRPGDFEIDAYPITSSNGTATYAPLGLGSNLTVQTGTTYVLNFTRAVQVTIAPANGGTVTPAGTDLWVAPGTAESFTATPLAGYTFLGWSGKGAGSYTGTSLTATFVANGPIQETPAFAPLPENHYSLSFFEGTLPAGTPWSVFVDGTGYTTTATTLTVPNLYGCSAGAIGTYSIYIPYVYVNGTSAERFVPATYPGTLCGGSSAVGAGFSPQYLLSLENTSGGLASATLPSSFQTLNGSIWIPGGEGTTLSATPSVGFSFVTWAGNGSGSYSGPSLSPIVVPTGAITEIAEFAALTLPAPPTYSVTFTVPSPPPGGLIWKVTVGATSYVATGMKLVVSGLAPGSYSIQVPVDLAASGQVQWTPVGAPTSLTVAGNRTVELSFQTLYWLTVRTVGEGTVNPGSGWLAAGASFSLTANPAAGSVFVGWAGTGNGSYSGPETTASSSVQGPIVEVATFSVASVSSAAAPTNPWTSTSAIVGLAAAGLVAGVLVGWLAFRRGRPPAPASEPPTVVESPMPVPEEGGEVTP